MSFLSITAAQVTEHLVIKKTKHVAPKKSQLNNLLTKLMYNKSIIILRCLRRIKGNAWPKRTDSFYGQCSSNAGNKNHLGLD